MPFVKAKKAGFNIRLGLVGPSGSGKTFTALRVGCELARLAGGRVAFIDTERKSSLRYADAFDFDAMFLEEFSPNSYITAIEEAEAAGYPVIIVDSLSHAWMGKGGVLEIKEQAAKRKKGDSFGAWRDATPEHNKLVDKLLSAKGHLIITMRVKTDYLVTTQENGRGKVEKLGLAPVQRDGLEYEFDIVGDLDLELNFIPTKTRCRHLKNEQGLPVVIHKPGEELAQLLFNWTQDTEAMPEIAQATITAPAIATAALKPSQSGNVTAQVAEYVLPKTKPPKVTLGYWDRWTELVGRARYLKIFIPKYPEPIDNPMVEKRGKELAAEIAKEMAKQTMAVIKEIEAAKAEVRAEEEAQD